MTLNDLLIEAKKLSPQDQLELAHELLKDLTANLFQIAQKLTPQQPKLLVTLLLTLPTLEEDWPDCDENLLPLENDIDF